MWSVGRVVRAAIGLSLLTTACSEAGDPTTSSGRAAIAYEAAVRSIVEDQRQHPSATTGGTSDDDDRPVVYVVAFDGESIDPDVQAKVANELRDEIDVRFADKRAEAVDDDDPEEPVKAHGVLLVVGSVPDSPASFDLRLERYSSIAERDVVTMSFGPDGESWTITSTSIAQLN
jgi:hypothetical protein